MNWASGVNLKTGRPVINPEARYGDDGVNVMPGAGGGHVWPPWSYNPTSGLVYIPSTIGAGVFWVNDPKFVPKSTELGATGKGEFNMGNSFKRAPTPATGAHAEANDSSPPPPPGFVLPSIGPQGHGNILVAWDPIAQKERWRGSSAGFNQGGTLSSADLVFVERQRAPDRLSRRQRRAAC